MYAIAILLASANLCDSRRLTPGKAPVYPRTNDAAIPALFARHACNRPAPARRIALAAGALAAYAEHAGQIRAALERGVLYACRFAIAEWGCGTACQTGVAVDVFTGAINRLPTSEWGRGYRPDSLLLITNPPPAEPDENERPEYAYPAYYVWSNGAFELLCDTRTLLDGSSGNSGNDCSYGPAR